MNDETKKAPTEVEALTDRNNANTEHHDTGWEAERERLGERTKNALIEHGQNTGPDAEQKARHALIAYAAHVGIDRFIDSVNAVREYRRQQALDAYLENRFGFAFRNEREGAEFLRVLDADPADDVPVEGGVDGEVETVSDRLWNHADAEGLLWASDADDGPVVLFVVLDESTAALFTREQRAKFPEVRVFSACPGLPLLDLSACFNRAGLDIDDYAPNCSTTWELTAEMFEALTDPAVPDDEEDDEEDDEVAPNTPLDLYRLRTEPRPPTAYREPGVIPVGRYIGISGEAGAGKSVLMRDFAVHWSQGRSAFDPAHRFDPAEVVYLDWENGPEWWAEGLDKMDAPLDLPNLRVICYPDLDGGTDTERGSRSFLRLVESLGEVDVLVIDTAGRVNEGPENDSDTWHRFYRLSILPLRRAGIDVVRLDHTGKNAEQGARGSSAKMSDLDAHYILTATAKGSNDLTLKLDKRRQADYDESVRIRRMDAPLRHVRVPDGKLRLRTDNGREIPENDKVAVLVADLDRLHITYGYGRVRAQEEYAAKGGEIKAGNGVWVDAIRFRSESADRESEQ